MGGPAAGRAEYGRVCVQFAPVRLRAGLDLCRRSGRRRRHGAALPPSKIRMSPAALPAHPRILVIALRRIGDVLLTTPLIRSLRRAYADARIDVLVFADTAGILDGNP